MEAGMSYDLASLEAKILSLDVKSMMVLSMLHKTTSDEEIIRWSGAWNYTRKDIDRAMQRIFFTLGLDSIPCHGDRRRAAAEKFITYSKFLNPQTRHRNEPYKKETIMEEREHASVAADDISIDTIAPVATKIGKLQQKRRDFVKCLVQDVKPEQIARELGLSESTVTQYKTVIFSELGLPKSLGIKNRMNILKQAWDLYNRTKKAPIAESTTRPPPEIMARPISDQVKPAVTQADQPKSGSLPANMSAEVMPAVHFVDSVSIAGVKVIPADGTISNEMLTEGYRCEALIACQQRGSANATAFLVMVLRT